MVVKRVRMGSCASDDKTGFGPGSRQNKQSIHQTMKKGRNRCPTQKTKVMERMTPLERWNGLAWVCTTWLWKGGMDLLGSVWNGYGKVLLVVEEKGVLGPQCSPKHNAFNSSGSLCGCDLTTSISSPRTSHGNNCESAQTDDLPRQPSKKHSKPMFRATFVTCSRTHQGMDTDGLERVDTDGLENWMSLPKKVTKEANQQDVSW